MCCGVRENVCSKWKPWGLLWALLLGVKFCGSCPFAFCSGPFSTESLWAPVVPLKPLSWLLCTLRLCHLGS